MPDESKRMSVSVSGKELVNWTFRLISLAVIPALIWAGEIDKKVALLERENESLKQATAEKLVELKKNTEKAFVAMETAHAKELADIKAQLGKMEKIEEKTDANSVSMARMEVKVDLAQNTLNEIKSAILSSR